MCGITVGRRDQLALLHDVGEAVGQPGGGRQPVTPGAPRLLVVPLDRLGQVEVRDEPDVGLVDAHAEGDRRDHDQAVLAQEPGLVRGAHRRGEPRVVGQRRDPVLDERRGGLLHRRAREAVDDPCVPGVLGAQQVEQLRLRPVLGHDPVGDVGPVEAGDEVACALQLEALGDLGPRGRRRRRRQRDARDGRPALVQHRQLEVVGPEVVAPLGHAVRLVDREERDRRPVEQVEGGAAAEALRRHVEQVELTRHERALHGAAVLRGQRGVEERRADAERREGVHLVLHEGDERGHHDAGPRADQGGDLVAQRLAPAGRHEDQGVAAADDGVDDRGLLAPERVVPEDPPEHVERGVRRSVGRSRCGHPGTLTTRSDTTVAARPTRAGAPVTDGGARRAGRRGGGWRGTSPRGSGRRTAAAAP